MKWTKEQLDALRDDVQANKPFLMIARAILMAFTGLPNPNIDRCIHLYDLVLEEIEKPEPDNDVLAALVDEMDRLKARIDKETNNR